MYTLLFYFMDLQNVKEVNYRNILKISKQLKKLKIKKEVCFYFLFFFTHFFFGSSDTSTSKPESFLSV